MPMEEDETVGGTHLDAAIDRDERVWLLVHRRANTPRAIRDGMDMVSDATVFLCNNSKRKISSSLTTAGGVATQTVAASRLVVIVVCHATGNRSGLHGMVVHTIVTNIRDIIVSKSTRSIASFFAFSKRLL